MVEVITTHDRPLGPDPDYRHLGPDPEPVVPRFESIMRAARTRTVTRRRPRRPDRSHAPERRRETPGQARERRERARAAAHARTVAAMRELDAAVHRGELWCERLEVRLTEAGHRADDLTVALRRVGLVAR